MEACEYEYRLNNKYCDEKRKYYLIPSIEDSKWFKVFGNEKDRHAEWRVDVANRVYIVDIHYDYVTMEILSFEVSARYDMYGHGRPYGYEPSFPQNKYSEFLGDFRQYVTDVEQHVDRPKPIVEESVVRLSREERIEKAKHDIQAWIEDTDKIYIPDVSIALYTLCSYSPKSLEQMTNALLYRLRTIEDEPFTWFGYATPVVSFILKNHYIQNKELEHIFSYAKEKSWIRSCQSVAPVTINSIDTLLAIGEEYDKNNSK